MKKLYFLLLCCSILRPVMAQQVYWQQEVNYAIDVSLNDIEHTLDGFLKLQYINHSPDTLSFIWFHLWPNAYKNDKTAFSEQMLQNGSTDFYFSGKEQRGYINRLDFRINNFTLKTEDHPQYIDVVKVYLPEPLLPGQQTAITTPFHVQLPAVFSRSGHVKKAYNITQWYPKPAVYDRNGWHPMPYLNQGEFYSEYGSFDVHITIPSDYVVAATGDLQNPEEIEWLKGRSAKNEVKTTVEVIKGQKSNTKSKQPVKSFGTKKFTFGKKPAPKPVTNNQQPVTVKTLHYTQGNVHDFAWFANKNFIVLQDTLQLPSGKIINAYSYFTGANPSWKKSLQYTKDAVRFRSSLIGEYPYNVVSVVEAPLGFDGGMEYPTITSIAPAIKDAELDRTIEHEVGHNWFYGILGSNERRYPWMDEGINTYYDQRYMTAKYGSTDHDVSMEKKLRQVILAELVAERKDQPVASTSEDFTWLNYNIIAYGKTADWLQWMEDSLGRKAFDAGMRQYYNQWQFKHPLPGDFKQVMENNSGRSLQSFFTALDTTGNIPPVTTRKKIRPAFFFSLKDYQHTHYINIMPAIGYNMYDKFMVGGMIHNYGLPSSRFRFMLTPLYATGSKQLNGLAHVEYNWYAQGLLKKIVLGAGAARFSMRDGVDSTGATIQAGFTKLTPSLRVVFRNKDARSTVEKWLEWKTFLIGEESFGYKVPVGDSVSHPFVQKTTHRYLNQLTFNITDYRQLYPYDAELQVQQAKDFYRINATANYLFNYAKGGGMRVRVFAAKFGYIGDGKYSSTARYQPKLTAVRGDEDYTYSNYFIGRNEFSGFASQQIMLRDAALKLRYDLFADPPVRTDNWIAAINLNTTLPNGLFPVKLPVRLFLDVGTYAESWKKDVNYSKFLYVGGLQVTLFKELLNIYMPLVYSKAMRDNTKTEKQEFTFWKRLSFSLDIQRFNRRKIIGPMGF
ncbi:MAG: M1 family metallopeptidase [Chitinophagaceae bacterium]